MLALWLERIAELPLARREDLRWLGDAERRRCAGLGSQRRRIEFLAGRDLLRRLLRARGRVGESQPLSLTAEGAPRLEGRPDLHLSLSHRRGWQVAALSDAPVGVDIEIESARDVPALADTFCTAGERHRLAALTAAAPAEALTHLHELWALKEAAFKAAFPEQQAHRAAQLETCPAPAGSGTARAWRWPDGRVLALVATGFDRLDPVGIDGGAGPACWHVGVRYNP